MGVGTIRSRMASAMVGLPTNLVPAIDRQLAGDDQEANIVAVLDDLQQIALLRGRSNCPARSVFRRRKPGSIPVRACKVVRS
jgi:hypothetical protein